MEQERAKCQKFQKLRKKQEKEEKCKGPTTHTDIKDISYDEEKGVSPAWQEVWKVEKSCPPVLNKIWANTENYLLHI